MTIDKQALREEFRLMQAHYSDPADRARQVIYIAAEALLDELDKKQQYIKLRDQENEDIALTVGKLRVELEHYKSREERVTKLVLDNSTSWDVLYEKLEAAERRIAELEARAVNLPKRSVDEVMHLSGFSRDYAEGWCAGNDNAIHEIRAAGIKVKES
ncbi:ead/Ea22-like family protein [Salmonella enterica]|uniref:Ead/Ea22-like family protein n=1 Tax=Salmonella oranienberg TaxID=28147 RepID=A0A730I164_SALON|nr:ead/Ea22-like family protein [Salmonella enterica]EBU4960442.1 ead/Ea22-like family protein [Salmonella enterica subsp. enterica]ECS6612716.1 ead/Ea22-like family protein [Salmonella enterica subsp. enterica serovar Give]ECS7967845.1 ead/Ea22-like family protein [Salmonella enterica subsp. enterica serovar Poona]EED8610962.1 ead/Ea22-like family protein [Salmonella enterica subsp. enterica serovar Glostrup]EEJ3759645.1 ead/Ea22-like family protein [Salmonella enterica subsp. enterica serova